MSVAFDVRTGDPARAAVPLLVLALPAEPAMPRALASLDKRYGGALSAAIRRKDFQGGRDESLLLFASGGGPQRVLLVGMGTEADRRVRLAALRGAHRGPSTRRRNQVR